MEIRAGDYRLLLEPERGGSILAFEWRGEALLRPACGPTILDVACFPLVPFSNRIAFGRFQANGREVQLRPNFPGSDHPHTLHGFGWLASWTVEHSDVNSVTLGHHYLEGEWPWPYYAEQQFELTEEGLTIGLQIINHGQSLMPAGLGLHPYFPRDCNTVYYGLHHGEWRNDGDCLPQDLDLKERAIDWWDGRNVEERRVDTVYTNRQGILSVAWPSRNLSLVIQPGDALPHTVVYTPEGQNFICVEPVSHATNALNSSPDDVKWLKPGESFAAVTSFRATRNGSKPYS